MSAIVFQNISSLSPTSSPRAGERRAPSCISSVSVKKSPLLPSQTPRIGDPLNFEHLSSLRREIEQFKSSLEVSPPKLDLNEWISEQLSQSAEEAHKEHATLQTYEKLFTSGLNDYRDTFDLSLGAFSSVSTTLPGIAPQLDGGEKLEMARSITDFSVGVTDLSSMSFTFSHLLFQHHVLSKAKKQLKETKSDNLTESQKEVITKLENWILKQQKVLNKEIHIYGLRNMADLPDAVSALLKKAGKLSHITSNTLALSGTGLNLLLATYTLYSAKKEERVFDVWGKKVRAADIEVKEELNTSAGTTESNKKVTAHLKQQKEILTAKFTPQLNEILTELSQSRSLESAIGMLRKHTIDLESLNTRRKGKGLDRLNLENLRSPDEVTRALIIEQLSQRPQALQTSVRNALKTLVATKQTLTKRFFSFRTKYNALGFSLSLASTVTIALKATAVIAGVASAATGFGLIGAGVVLLGLGTYYYYKNHVNLLKTKMTTSYFKMMLHSIPQAFKTWSLEWKNSRLLLLQMEKNKECIELSNQILKIEREESIAKTLKGISYDQRPFNPIQAHEEYLQLLSRNREKLGELKTLKTRLEEKKETYQAKIDTYKKEIESQKESLLAAKEKFADVHTKLKEAVWKDYLTMMKAEIPHDSKAYEKLLEELPTFLTELISEGNLDPNTKNILQSQMNIDSSLLEKTDLSEGELKDKLKDGIKTFFGLEADHLYKVAVSKDKEDPIGGLVDSVIMDDIEES